LNEFCFLASETSRSEYHRVFIGHAQNELRQLMLLLTTQVVLARYRYGFSITQIALLSMLFCSSCCAIEFYEHEINESSVNLFIILVFSIQHVTYQSYDTV
jgi:NADH:ubiquinone oxidoreductase subunit B-like Fe-S oxidoreductase